MTASMFAQSPEKMSYQAVVRDGSDNLVTSAAVGMQISILQGTANGSAVYVETQTPTANANGLVSLEIGTGTVVSGDFSTIDWATGPYFIKTETDPSGGTNYSITGTSQLMSVPYALYAKTSENGITAEQTTAIETNTAKVGYTEALVSANTAVEANTAKTGITTAQAEAIGDNTVKEGVKNGTTAGEMQYWDGSEWVSVEVSANEGATLQLIGGVPTWTGGTAPSPKVGDYKEGGVIFYIFQSGEAGYVIRETHGLVCAVEDQSSEAEWGCYEKIISEANGTAIGSGADNTSAILADCNEAGIAAKICDVYSVTVGNTTYNDWFLPSKDELNEIYKNKDDINTTAESYSGNSFNDDTSSTSYYWSSSQSGGYFAIIQDFNDDDDEQKSYSKFGKISVRAVRAF